MENEREGRFTFYGMMIAEGIIAMIWAAAAMSLFDGYGGLQELLAAGGPGAAPSRLGESDSSVGHDTPRQRNESESSLPATLQSIKRGEYMRCGFSSGECSREP